ncbi:hypothetical protein RD792_016455 [Penstemon davidsonii]|uniref:Uncharacterized protein n=1 Tax=Penstemon davidsonii TaxID=160366 RepID=A0ABR0CJC6_9LAMI|nr:hypothetical protein RD792_016455 [Penstemon davidsonii]
MEVMENVVIVGSGLATSHRQTDGVVMKYLRDGMLAKFLGGIGLKKSIFDCAYAPSIIENLNPMWLGQVVLACVFQRRNSSSNPTEDTTWGRTYT